MEATWPVDLFNEIEQSQLTDQAVCPVGGTYITQLRNPRWLKYPISTSGSNKLWQAEIPLDALPDGTEVDENGLNTKTIMNNIVKAGTTLFVTKTKDRSRWAHFTARSNVNDTGSFLTLGVNLNAKSEKEIKKDDDVTVQFNVSAPVEIPPMIKADKVLELEELLGKMRKEITTLKASVTRLKNGNGK